MLATGWGIALAAAALGLFAFIGIRAAAGGADDRDRYLSARGTQGPLPLALNFFASVLGAWILFSVPEIGTFAGLWGVLGYAIGQAAAVAVFAVVGPRVREALPDGTTILELVRIRYGRAMQGYAGVVSISYMFFFLAAELTAIAGAMALLAGVDPWVSVVAVTVVTVAYTAYGGLPASIATDRLQGWLIMGLIAVGVGALIADVPAPLDRARAGGLDDFTRPGFEVAVVLVIAIVAANLFHQGFWQRVWAGRDERAVRLGALGGGALIVPVLLLMGAVGTIWAGAAARPNDPLQTTPSLAFFSFMGSLPKPVLGVIVLLAVALVASSVDTLQNALTSLFVVDVSGGRMSVGSARIATVALAVPAAVIGAQELSVLRLFLIADLLAATIAAPVFLGLWRRVPPAAVLAGSVTGLVSVVAVGAARGAAWGGLHLLSLPEGPSIGAFLAAAGGSALVTVGWTVLAPRTADAPAPRTRV